MVKSVLLVDRELKRMQLNFEDHFVRELTFFDELANLIKSVRTEFACGLAFSLERLERGPEPLTLLIQSLGDDFLHEDFHSILRDENNIRCENYRKSKNAFDKKREYFFRSKPHSLRPYTARIFRESWLARGNISQF